jgi:hypothetical protein
LAVSSGDLIGDELDVSLNAVAGLKSDSKNGVVLKSGEGDGHDAGVVVVLELRIEVIRDLTDAVKTGVSDFGILVLGFFEDLRENVVEVDDVINVLNHSGDGHETDVLVSPVISSVAEELKNNVGKIGKHGLGSKGVHESINEAKSGFKLFLRDELLIEVTFSLGGEPVISDIIFHFKSELVDDLNEELQLIGVLADKTFFLLDHGHEDFKSELSNGLIGVVLLLNDLSHEDEQVIEGLSEDIRLSSGEVTNGIETELEVVFLSETLFEASKGGLKDGEHEVLELLAVLLSHNAEDLSDGLDSLSLETEVIGGEVSVEGFDIEVNALGEFLVDESEDLGEDVDGGLDKEEVVLVELRVETSDDVLEEADPLLFVLVGVLTDGDDNVGKLELVAFVSSAGQGGEGVLLDGVLDSSVGRFPNGVDDFVLFDFEELS